MKRRTAEEWDIIYKRTQDVAGNVSEYLSETWSKQNGSRWSWSVTVHNFPPTIYVMFYRLETDKRKRYKDMFFDPLNEYVSVVENLSDDDLDDLTPAATHIMGLGVELHKRITNGLVTYKMWLKT